MRRQKRRTARARQWELDRRTDPLLGRTLTHWPENNKKWRPPDLQQHSGLTQGAPSAQRKSNKDKVPPEPNGYLHLGHAKSMNMNFSLAFERLEGAGVSCKRETVFRYDDTNPEAETKEFIESLATDVQWMGWSPVVTTHTSDYFPVFYAMALDSSTRARPMSATSRRRRSKPCRSVARREWR